MSLTPNLDAVLAAYEPIGLAEMDRVRLMNRVDTKYVLSDAELVAALDGLADEYRVVQIEGLRRCPYKTLYFDTPTLRCYHEHHNGKANRRKYRMRTYASSGATFFEVKTKTNKGRTVKQRIPIPAIDESIDPESKALAEAIAGAPLSLSAQMWTTFRRVTLVARNTAERVTLDTDLHFKDGQRLESLDGFAIAEVKQPRLDRDSPIQKKLRGLRVRPMRFSKYCVGSALLRPSLKRNAFKSRLAAIK